MKKYQIEVCACSVQSAVYAEAGGADRVELCDNYWEGGTTPSLGTMRQVAKLVGIPFFPLIRPRGGDFTYGKNEFAIMKEDILIAKEAGAGGIVSGVLTAEGAIDIPRTAKLVALADPLPFTFHRAFDLVQDPRKALKDLITIGVPRLLTSGLAAAAIQGKAIINDLVERSGGAIRIMAGGGVTPENVQELYAIGCREFHFSAKSYVQTESSYMKQLPMNASSDIPEDRMYVSNPQLVELLKSKLDELA